MISYLGSARRDPNPAEAAILPVSIDAAMAMRAMFAQDSPAVRALFDALVELPTKW